MENISLKKLVILLSGFLARILCLKKIYVFVWLKTDKKLFAVLFNIKSILLGRSARLSWDGSTFLATDNEYPWFSYKVRPPHRCMVYEGGLLKRAENLADDYFLREIDFKSGDVFVDCGANVGDVKLWFMLNKIDVDYIGFEPGPIEFKYLEENVKPSKVYNVALWNESGEMTFYVSPNGADSCLIKPAEYDEMVTSKVVRLENFIDARIKCLKLEAEGAEPEVLDGLGDKIKLVEYVAADLGYERGINSESTLIPVTNYLLQNGFELIEVGGARLCALYRNKLLDNN